VPRHCHHTGFGLRDLHRLVSGPSYAARRVALASEAGVQLRAGAMVTDWADTTSVVTTSREGRTRIAAEAVLLATGCRERPRPARLVPGSRPAGVFTTGALQQWAHLRGRRVGAVAVVVGAEHIAFSAVQTLVGSGTRVAAVVTDSPALQTFRSLAVATAGIRRVPVLAHTRLDSISGRGRVDGVVVTSLDTGASRRIDCDTVVFTGDWIPDHELARAAGVDMDLATRGPVVDTSGATSVPGVFAAGNLVHPAEPADLAALSGQHVGAAVVRWLASGDVTPAVPVSVADPLAWITPQLVRPGVAAPRFVLRAARPSGTGQLVVRQDGRELHRSRRLRLVPNRHLGLSSGWTASVDPSGGPVWVGYLERQRLR
jgi:thioredoxin reductase